MCWDHGSVQAAFLLLEPGQGPDLVQRLLPLPALRGYFPFFGRSGPSPNIAEDLIRWRELTKNEEEERDRLWLRGCSTFNGNAKDYAYFCLPVSCVLGTDLGGLF